MPAPSLVYLSNLERLVVVHFFMWLALADWKKRPSKSFHSKWLNVCLNAVGAYQISGRAARVQRSRTITRAVFKLKELRSSWNEKFHQPLLLEQSFKGCWNCFLEQVRRRSSAAVHKIIGYDYARAGASWWWSAAREWILFTLGFLISSSMVSSGIRKKKG